MNTSKVFRQVLAQELKRAKIREHERAEQEAAEERRAKKQAKP